MLQRVSCVNAPRFLFNSLSSRNSQRRGATTAALVERAARSPDLDEQLSEILALKQAEESRGRILQALDHVFAVFEATATHPIAGFAQEIGFFGGEIRDDEAAQSQAFAQHREHVWARHRGCGAVLGDEPAHRYAGEIVEQ